MMNNGYHSTTKPSMWKHGQIYNGCGKHAEYTEYMWFKNNKLHKEGGKPAVTQLYDSGRRLDAWFIDNIEHRMDGPSKVLIKKNGLTKKEWKIHGMPLDRRSLPFVDRIDISLEHPEGIPQLKGPKLNRTSIMKALLFDREYGTFLQDICDGKINFSA